MRVVFSVKSMNVEGGGAERVLSEVASGLAKQGHQIILLTLDDPHGHSFYPLHPSIQRVYVEIGNPRKSAGTVETLRRIHKMRRVIKQLRPDIVVGFMHSMFIPMGLALLGTGIPLIASEHIVPGHYKSRPLQALLLLFTPFFTRRITVVSEQVCESYPSLLKTHMTVIPNPVNVHSRSYANVVGEPAKRKTLLTVGRLSAQKDHASLIDSFAEIADEIPDWDLRIVGEGELRSQLEAQIQARGLEGRVQLPGIIKDISSEYASAHLFVISSLYESFGLATAEALAHRLPAIGFAECQGTNQLIKSGVNGLLVEGGMRRVKALAMALKRLMQNDNLRRNMANAQIDLPIASLEKVLDNWRELLFASISNRAGEGSVSRVNTFAEEISSLIGEVSYHFSTSADLSKNILQQDNFKGADEVKIVQFADRMKEVISFINEIAARINVLALNLTLETMQDRRSGASKPSISGELNELAEKTFQTTQQMEHLIGTITESILGGSNSSSQLNDLSRELEDIAENYAVTVNETLSGLKLPGEEKSFRKQDQANEDHHAADRQWAGIIE